MSGLFSQVYVRSIRKFHFNTKFYFYSQKKKRLMSDLKDVKVCLCLIETVWLKVFKDLNDKEFTDRNSLV